jgi:galactokinase
VIAAYAPGRVELLGNHTDYNEGVVLGAAIDRGLTVRGSGRSDGIISINSAAEGHAEIPISDLRPQTDPQWTNYAFGVVSEFVKLGVTIAGFDAQVQGNLPARCGLSSSAALEIATALFLLKLCRRKLPRLEIAKACQRAEHYFVGVQTGLLDQVTVIFGRANQAVSFDCRTEEVRTIPFPSDLALIVAQSAGQRELAAGEYNKRREETAAAAQALGVRALRDVSPEEIAHANELSPLLRRRALHVAEENTRVWQAVDLLRAGDGIGFGALMNASHESSRENFENSTPELDRLVKIAQAIPGVLGARLTGAGFGGATVTLCQRARVNTVAEEIADQYTKQTGVKTQVFICHVAGGAA